MSAAAPPLRRHERRRRRTWPRVVAVVLAIAVAFLAGYGLGRAVDDNPEPGAPVTTIREIQPLPATTPG